MDADCPILFDVYLAGPMRGIPLYNFPAFDAAAAHYRARGLTVCNPAEVDREAGFDPTTLPADHDWSRVPSGMSFDALIGRDLALVRQSASVAVLPRWNASQGARLEVAEILRLDRAVRVYADDIND